MMDCIAAENAACSARDIAVLDGRPAEARRRGVERPFAHDQAPIQGWGRAARLNPELVQATLGGSSRIKCVSPKIELVATLVPRPRAPHAISG